MIAKDHEKETDKKLDTLQKDKLVKDLSNSSALLHNAQIDIVKKDTKITDQNMALDNKDTAIQSKDKKITEDKGKVKAAMEKSFAMQAEMFKMLTHAGMDSKGGETMFQTFNTSVFAELGELYTPPVDKDKKENDNHLNKTNK